MGRLAPLAAGAIAFGFYAGTAARTITWWDGSSYPLAAVTLGVPGAPGSLLLTLLGWIVSRIPIVHPVAFQLHLFAGLLAALLVALLTWLGARLATPEDREPGPLESFAGAVAGLTFGFALTPWTYAVQFTPYVLSALWTALILWSALAWWRRPATSDGSRQLFLLCLLLGLDFSVHRTNLLLVPALLAWVALRSPVGLHPLRGPAAAAAGLTLGLAFHLLLIPISAAHPSYAVEDASTWAGWWSYVTLERQGGGFLVNLFPRTADFISVQLADYLEFLRANLSRPLFLPAALALLGWCVIFRSHPRRALGLLTFFLSAGLCAVVYFNLPHGYMRPIDRHYLPSLVVVAPWIAVGVAAVLRLAARAPGRLAVTALVAAGSALLPVAQLVANRRACDLSRVRFAETLSRDVLEPLPEHAILFTNGDNDTIPLWYMQQVESVRPDVRVVNLPLTNSGAFIAQLRASDPDLSQLLGAEHLPRVFAPTEAPSQPVVTAVEPGPALGLPSGSAAPDSVRFHLDGMILAQDRVVLDILQRTRWRRPLLVALTVAPGNLDWVRPYLRLDGLAFRVVPSDDPRVMDLDRPHDVLLRRVRYAGIADTLVPLDAASRGMSRNYLRALFQLASSELELGRPDRAIATVRFAEGLAVPGRLAIEPDPFPSLRRRSEEALAAKQAKR